MTAASEKARNIKLLIVDIDGVLTDGGLHFDNRGEEYKTFNSLDGHGIRMLLESDIEFQTALTCEISEAGVDTIPFVNQNGCDSLVIVTTQFVQNDTTFSIAPTCLESSAGIDTIVTAVPGAVDISA